MRKGQILSGALLSGKISTTVLFISLTLMVMIPDLNNSIIHLITTIDCIFMLISFVDYARLYYTHSPMIQAIEPEQNNE